MRIFSAFMPKLVETLAIRSKRDLVIKACAFYLFFIFLGLPFEWLSNGTDNLSSFADDAWLTILISTPVLILQFSVVTYLDKLQRQLTELAMTDGLTGLPNRRSFMERAEQSHAETEDGTVFVLDADYFKRINDTYGHAIGDACLKAVAARMFEVKSGDDIVARLGGEEFAAYLPAATDARIRQFGDSLTRPIKVELDDNAGEVTFTMSVGAAKGGPKDTLRVLLSRADVALYEAKHNGRAQMVVWREMKGEFDV